MSTLPLALPVMTRGFAALTPASRAEGARIAGAVSAAISNVLGMPIRIDARPLPHPPRPALGVAQVLLQLDALGAPALLEIDAGLLARTLDRLASRPVLTPAALTASELERAMLAFLALVAVDAAVALPAAAPLAPRVAVDAGDAPGDTPGDGLAVALEIATDEDRGRGQLVIPAAAVVRLGAGATVEPSHAARALAVTASLRHGTSSLAPDELAALAPGDFLLLDDGPPRAELVFPGGLAARGRLQDSHLHVEEIRMNEAQAAYPLTLSVEIARVTVTLGELARLTPGAALPLDARKDGAVVLRAGERAIARGQLVEIEGALGVRIAQLGELP